MSPVHALDGVAADLVPEVEQRAANARVAPCGVLLRHMQHELDDVGCSTRSSAGTSSAAVVLGCDKAPVPPHQRVWGHQSVELLERFAPEPLRGRGQPTSLSIRVNDAPASELLAQHSVLCEQILCDALVIARHPTGDGQ